MRIHPEMRELVEQEMREGLQHWRDKTPEEINQRMRARLLADQKALRNIGALRDPRHGLAWRSERTKCDCPCDMFGNAYHLPWCAGTKKIVFVTPDKPIEKDGRMYYSNSMFSPWFMGADDEEDKKDE